MKIYDMDVKDAFSNFAKAFLTNLKTIIFAFVVSVIIWLAISFQVFPDVADEFEIPVSAELTAYMRDVKLELADEFDETVTVSVEGKRYEIASLNADDFYAYLDFSDVRGAGDHVVDVVVRARDEVNSSFLTPGDNFTRVVKIIQIAEKTLRTTPDAQGIKAVDGMTIEYANVAVNPEAVTISGEKSLIDSVHSVRVSVTSNVPLSATAVLEGELAFLNSRGEIIESDGIYIEDRAFTVVVPVFKRKTLPLEVTILAPDNFDLDALYSKMRIEPAELTLASPDASIDNHDVWSLGTISLSDITFSNLEAGLPIQITLPEGYENISGNHEVRLFFDDMGDYDSRTFQVPAANFNNINVPAGFDVRHITRMISVKVVGPSNVIYAMTIADIRGTISLAGITDIETGERSIGVKFTIAGTNVTAWVIDEYKIDIEIIQTN
jgi:YbbR domain-containing protein